MRKTSSPKNSAIFGVITQDPNLIWLAHHLAQSQGSEAVCSETLKNLKIVPNLNFMVIDFDCLNEKGLISGIRRDHPSIVIFALTSRADLCDALSEEGVERVFLKPYLIEPVYAAILENLKKTEINSKKSVLLQGIPKAKVLVVDDEVEVCEFIRDVLEESEAGEFKVRFAHDPENALKLCVDFEPDLVIADLKLPQISGLELIERFKRLASCPKDFLIFSGSDDRSKHIVGYSFLPKSSHMNEIVSAMTDLCRKWNLLKKAA
ncbi:MAG: response regulator [Candidatus Omnitrophica bacterium]|nr:response regulator [Candidatus Omnitrophota bacterium]